MGDDEVSFGQAVQRQLSDPHQPAHVRSRCRRDRQRHLEATPAMAAKHRHRHLGVAQVDRGRLVRAHLREDMAADAGDRAAELEHGDARRRLHDAPGVRLFESHCGW